MSTSSVYKCVVCNIFNWDVSHIRNDMRPRHYIKEESFQTSQELILTRAEYSNSVITSFVSNKSFLILISFYEYKNNLVLILLTDIHVHELIYTDVKLDTLNVK